MKQRLLLACLFISGLAAAHDIKPLCWNDGRFKFACSDFADGGKDYVKIHISSGTWGNGTADTLFKIAPSFQFVVFVPQPDINTPITVTFTNTNVNGSAHGETHIVLTSNCNALPLKFGKIKAERLDEETVRVYVTVYNVENVKEILINISVDGRAYQTRATIIPDQGLSEKTYTATIKIEEK
jgi:hypothetical protein